MRNVLRAALLVALAAPASVALGIGPAPTPSGTAWLLVDGPTGEVLAQRNADVPRPMASTTKMMTALVAMESGDLDRVVAGSEADFVTRMNDKARELGLKQTNFENPHGLDEAGHQSSPHDLLVLGREVMKQPFLRQLVGQRTITIPGPGGRPTRLQSENDLLSIMPDADGIKTGHTDKAGFVEVAHATSGTLGRDLYAVVMGEPSREARAQDAKALLEWGFAHYARPVVIRRGQRVVDLEVQGGSGATVPLAPASPVAATVRVGQPVSMRVVAPAMAAAPLAKGQRVGRVEVVQDGAVLARSALVATADAPEPGVTDAFRNAFGGIWSVFS